MMMNTTRRGFLRLLGIGGATAAVGIPLFSQGVPILGTGDHLVYSSPVRLKADARAFFLYKYSTPSAFTGETVGRLVLRNPRLTPLRNLPPSQGVKVGSVGREGDTWAPYGTAHRTYQINCPVVEGEDPHIAFYLAAEELQQAVNDDILTFGRELQGLTMITQVIMPILAFPHPDKGFYLLAEIYLNLP